jgi:hypothetical protein
MINGAMGRGVDGAMVQCDGPMVRTVAPRTVAPSDR